MVTIIMSGLNDLVSNVEICATRDGQSQTEKRERLHKQIREKIYLNAAEGSSSV